MSANRIAHLLPEFAEHSPLRIAVGELDRAIGFYWVSKAQAEACRGRVLRMQAALPRRPQGGFSESDLRKSEIAERAQFSAADAHLDAEKALISAIRLAVDPMAAEPMRDDGPFEACSVARGGRLYTAFADEEDKGRVRLVVGDATRFLDVDALGD